MWLFIVACVNSLSEWRATGRELVLLYDAANKCVSNLCQMIRMNQYLLICLYFLFAVINVTPFPFVLLKKHPGKLNF